MTLSICNVGNVPQFAVKPTVQVRVAHTKTPIFLVNLLFELKKKTSHLLALSYMSYGGIIVET